VAKSTAREVTTNQAIGATCTRLIAFYLPQYHPILENDEWWGQGFTDWVNVARARPRFRGHYQPHIPADLGFYDLRLEETRVAQAEMAAEHGIGGFCYYHYWFNGKMLLERPFNEVLRSGRPEFPFCLCWANENWTRTWDGRDQHVLIGQDYDEYDADQHVEWLVQAFSDKRYIRVNGKPLFLVYCASRIPDIARMIGRWRNAVADKHYPGLYLCSVRSSANLLTDDDTINLGFDAVVEFQPDAQVFPRRNAVTKEVHRKVRMLLDRLRLQRFYSHLTVSNVVSYQSLVEKAISRPRTNRRLLPCVMPSWDNSARRKAAVIIQNDDADLYRKWLEDAVRRVSDYPPDEQIVFINAWNEWAEGCHLEPDLRNGRRFLEATREVLNAI
jgi:lipopolysaccharide biosynthesis protein